MNRAKVGFPPNAFASLTLSHANRQDAFAESIDSNRQLNSSVEILGLKLRH
jgi:hypothetical protein